MNQATRGIQVTITPCAQQCSCGAVCTVNTKDRHAHTFKHRPDCRVVTNSTRQS